MKAGTQAVLPGRPGLWLCLRVVESDVTSPRGIMGEGDLLPGSTHALPIHSEDRQSGVNRRPMKDGRGGVPLSGDARAHSRALGAHVHPPACHPVREKVGIVKSRKGK